jgi:hypothetical protein
VIQTIQDVRNLPGGRTSLSRKEGIVLSREERRCARIPQARDGHQTCRRQSTPWVGVTPEDGKDVVAADGTDAVIREELGGEQAGLEPFTRAGGRSVQERKASVCYPVPK